MHPAFCGYRAVVWAFVLISCVGFGRAAAREAASVELPEGVKAVWDLDQAYREATPTRERICINGLWRWQPAAQDAASAPDGGWGYFKVPGEWPSRPNSGGSQTLYPHPVWAETALSDVNAAWYQREITVPADWAGRRIVLRSEWVNSLATAYVDGQQAGVIAFPGGELDITAACRPGSPQVLSMLVAALPLRAVMLAYNDTNSARQVRGSVARRGLCGDVYLIGEPLQERVGHVRLDTSVRNWTITFNTELQDLVPGRRYSLRAAITEGGQPVTELAGQPFSVDGLKEGQLAFTADWKPDKLWDIHTPRNQYEFSLSLLGEDGTVLDTSIPERFGFREFWINGRDFYLNGTRIYLSSVPVDNAGLGSAQANYNAVRETLRRLKTFGINMVYTHNYGCEPGTHTDFNEELQAADDEGMLLSFSQPHFGQYNWDAPDADETNGYARHAAFYVQAAGNHPSVVFYSTSHNSTGYSEDMNPDLIDGIDDARDPWSLRNKERALRAEAILKHLDPGRIVYHHSSGNLSAMYTMNFYANMVPIQEMCDWFEHWATKGVKPVFTCEYTVPVTWDWSMYRGWYKGRRAFGNATAPWELCIPEWNAQFFGDSAYRMSEEAKRDLRWEAEQFRAGRLWQRWDYPYPLNSDRFLERYPVYEMYFDEVWPAFRTWGMSANSPWFHGHYWRLRDGVDTGRKDFPVDWEPLQRPGLSPDYIEQGYGRVDLTHELSDWEPTVAAKALIRYNMPLLAYIAGKPAAFTSKDHNFLPGETVEKQLIVINNSREPVQADCTWSFGLPRAETGSRTFALPTGDQEGTPLRFALPADLAPGRYELTASVRFSTGETQQDSFAVDVLPPAQPVHEALQTALFDPKGETAALFDRLGVSYRRVDAGSDLAGQEVLVIGKGALTLEGAAPDVSRVRNGLKVAVFEQTGDVLEKRFGFRVADYGLRRVFRRVPDHPVLAGLNEESLRDWRGEATILPARLDYVRDPAWNYVPTVEWAGLTVPHLWRCGNRGNVASALIEKPAAGDFLSILDGGYSLQYTPLAEYREGQGMVLFCQMDVTGRTESDPAADVLARNILRYVGGWQPTPRRQVVYAGDALGRRQLESAGLTPLPYGPGALAADHVLVVAEADSFLPLDVKTTSAEHIASYFEPPAFGSLLAGVGPADVQNRDPKDLPLVSAGAQPVGDGVLATANGLNVVFCQMVPDQVNPALGTPTAFTAGKDASVRPGALVTLGPVTPNGARLSQRVEGAEAGKTYTLAVMVQAQGDDATARIGAERAVGGRGRGRRRPADEPAPAVGPLVTGEDVQLPAGRPTELHVSFTADAAGGQGVLVYLTSAQPGARLWIEGVRLYEGEYVPAGQGGAAANLVQNGDFSAGADPWQFDFTQQRNLKRTYRRTSCLVSRLLANMGASGRTRLLEHVSQPVKEGETRWLDGLYLDVPETWDDPYRFFRW
jgi:beta-galactosidase